jgi:hypothetical protein
MVHLSEHESIVAADHNPWCKVAVVLRHIEPAHTIKATPGSGTRSTSRFIWNGADPLRTF